MVPMPHTASPPIWKRPAACLRPALALAMALAPIAATAASSAGRVVAVADGDTLTVRTDDGRTVKVRLAAIDAPERGQPFGTKARDRLAAMTMGKVVTIRDRGEDRYGRTLADIEVDGRDVGRQIVSEGLAWHYRRFSDDQELAAAEAAARAARNGLWADRAPVPPWEWRATEKARKPQPVGR